WRVGPAGGTDEVPGRGIVSAGGGGTVDDHVGAGHGRVEPLVAAQVAGEPRARLRRRWPWTAAQYPGFGALGGEPGDQHPAQGAGASRDQDRAHRVSPARLRGSVGRRPSSLLTGSSVVSAGPCGWRWALRVVTS